MSDIGMENIEHNEWYDKKPEADSIAVACGSKKIDDFTLITIAVRGGGYGNEWSSTFTMGPSSNHEGFEKAAIDALVAFFPNTTSAGLPPTTLNSTKVSNFCRPILHIGLDLASVN